MKQKEKRNKFIILEGINCSGKTTIGKVLSENGLFEFAQNKCKELSTVEGFIEKQDEYARLMFYYSGNFFVSNYAKFLLESKHIVCDRYFYSTLVYHSFFSKCTVIESLEMMMKINDKLLRPDLVFYLTATENILIERLKKRGNQATEKEKSFIRNPSSLAVINELYLELFEAMPNRTKYIQIDSSGCVKDTCEMILEHIHAEEKIVDYVQR